MIKRMKSRSSNHAPGNDSSTTAETQGENELLSGQILHTLQQLEQQMLKAETSKNAAGNGNGKTAQPVSGAAEGQTPPAVKELQTLLDRMLLMTSNQSGTNSAAATASAANDGTENQSNADLTQLVSQAQYELANELEAGLTRLQQAIEASQKIAAKVSTILKQNGENPS